MIQRFKSPLILLCAVTVIMLFPLANISLAESAPSQAGNAALINKTKDAIAMSDFDMVKKNAG